MRERRTRLYPISPVDKIIRAVDGEATSSHLHHARKIVTLRPLTVRSILSRDDDDAPTRFSGGRRGFGRGGGPRPARTCGGRVAAASGHHHRAVHGGRLG